MEAASADFAQMEPQQRRAALLSLLNARRQKAAQNTDVDRLKEDLNSCKAHYYKGLYHAANLKIEAIHSSLSKISPPPQGFEEVPKLLADIALAKRKKNLVTSAISCYEQEQLESCKEKMEEALQIDAMRSDDGEILHYIGRCNLQMGNLLPALVCSSRMLAHEDMMFEFYRFRACVLDHIGLLDYAIQAMERALSWTDEDDYVVFKQELVTKRAALDPLQWSKEDLLREAGASAALVDKVVLYWKASLCGPLPAGAAADFACCLVDASLHQAGLGWVDKAREAAMTLCLTELRALLALKLPARAAAAAARVLPSLRAADAEVEELCRQAADALRDEEARQQRQRERRDKYQGGLVHGLPIRITHVSDLVGRGVVALRDFSTGEELFRTTPFIAYQLRENAIEVNACEFCMQPVRWTARGIQALAELICKRANVTPTVAAAQIDQLGLRDPQTSYGCTQCNRVTYCSKQCREQAWASYHRVLCVGQQAKTLGTYSEPLQKMHSFCHTSQTEAPNVARVVAMITAALDAGRCVEDALEVVCYYIRLRADHPNPVASGMRRLRSEYALWRAAMYDERLAPLRFFTFENYVRLSSVFWLNSIGVNVECPKRLGCNAVGGSLCDISCAMNHSCNPNVTVHCMHSRDLHVVARRPIKAGEEIFISYVPLNKNTAHRRRKLKGTYMFDCTCTRCMSEREEEEAGREGGSTPQADNSTRGKKGLEQQGDAGVDCTAGSRMPQPLGLLTPTRRCHADGGAHCRTMHASAVRIPHSHRAGGAPAKMARLAAACAYTPPPADRKNL
eukprot:CAMPEP_0177628930 /NCGR_PEP_ID=MMETSP0447-20121125/393_1 /TAXON_ID=0 /ORGANISM="Stygamoeba regulata, Strain BSH-02190019" /LENGTH=795 /DNA_ID=CAMNT_0019130209 /DNA_START=205 /DNA_END=2594 /DNA_ORIENTATION=-